MRKNSHLTTASRRQGFTLVEIMVVLLLFSIVLSFIVVNLDFHYTESAKVENFSHNFFAKIKLAKQEAILQHAMMRLQLEDNHYGFQVFQKRGNKYEWLWSHDPLLSRTAIKNPIRIHIIAQQKEVEPSTLFQIFPNGRITPFELMIADEKQSASFIISCDDSNNLGFKKNAKN